MKKTLSLLLSLVLMLSLALPASAAETEYPTLEGGVTEIQKYGNIVLDIDPADLKDGGYTYGDLLTVTVNGTGYDMPLCTNYSDVDTGALVLRDSEGVLIAAINMGDFATSNGLAAKVTAEDGSYTWEFPEGQSLESITVSISMKEQGGYYDQYLIHQLTRHRRAGGLRLRRGVRQLPQRGCGRSGGERLFPQQQPREQRAGPRLLCR